MSRILVVDDDSQGLDATRRTLELAGFLVIVASDGQQALQVFRSHLKSQAPIDLVISDVRMPVVGGIDFLKSILLIDRSMPVILMTAFGSVEDAVEAMKLGAVDFLTKPFKRQVLLDAVAACLKRAGASHSAYKAEGHETIVGSSEIVRQLKGMIQQVAATTATVLISGESGTGKELIARALHEQSARRKGPFVAINCAALPENLIEAELFGYEKGAFTGAGASHQGLFESANGGTLFLDEIGDMPVQLQTKLLRVLQESEVRRLGSTQDRKIDVRLVAATHQNLKDLVQGGRFRQDLLFRLEVVHLHSPSLRDRKEDIPELASYFLKEHSQRHDKKLNHLSKEAMKIMTRYSWPGNIRELSNVIERAIVFCDSNHFELSATYLPEHLKNYVEVSGADGSISVKIGTTLKDVEDLLIRKTLEATDGDRNLTAQILGVNSRTIYRKLQNT